MRLSLLILSVALLSLGRVTAAEAPASFLRSDDPNWKECLAYKKDFGKRKLLIEEFIGDLFVPHVLYRVEPDAPDLRSKIIVLSSAVLDQRTALWQFQRQTGVTIALAGKEPEILRGTIWITLPRTDGHKHSPHRRRER